MQTEFAGFWSALRSLIAGGVPASASAIKEMTIRLLHAAIPSGDGASALAEIMTVDDEARQELLGAVSSVAVASQIYKGVGQQRLGALGTFLQATIPGFDLGAMLVRSWHPTGRQRSR